MLNKVTCGNCLDLMRELPDNYVDSVITDPPYEIGFMGKSWDNTGIAFNTDVWAECLRVAKHGAFLLAFGGTRTWHRIACAIEDAGWTLRDTIAWHYGSGFPKSLSLSKAIDANQIQGNSHTKSLKKINEVRPGEGRIHNSDRNNGILGDGNNGGHVIRDEAITELAKTFDGYGTALKPSFEPIMVFMKPCDGTFAQNAEKWGVAGLNIDGGRIASGADYHDLKVTQGGSDCPVPITPSRDVPRELIPATGRWPANTILSCACDDEANHDADCPVRIMDEQSGVSKSGVAVRKNSGGNTFGGDNKKPAMEDMSYSDSGGASRFFYCAKPSRSEKEAGLDKLPVKTCGSYQFRHNENGVGLFDGAVNVQAHNTHATVKPVSLMRYLCKLTRPPHGGVVLDPFTGSGTTGIAAILEDRDFIGFELSQEYTDIANARIEHHAKQEDLCLSI